LYILFPHYDKVKNNLNHSQDCLYYGGELRGERSWTHLLMVTNEWQSTRKRASAKGKEIRLHVGHEASAAWILWAFATTSELSRKESQFGEHTSCPVVSTSLSGVSLILNQSLSKIRNFSLDCFRMETTFTHLLVQHLVLTDQFYY
jgi:hypothetical protein